jgi:recombination protein RecR
MEQGAFGHLVRELSHLPGLGPRSARRIALHLLTGDLARIDRLAGALSTAAQSLKVCSTCGNLDDRDPCHICLDPTRGRDQLAVVSGVADIWAMERTGQYKGRYHVLGGILSAIDGVTPEKLRIEGLVTRLQQETQHLELVLALPATVDGQATIHYICDRLHQALSSEQMPKITRLALGLPMGGELDYLDDGTITAALRARSVLS